MRADFIPMIVSNTYMLTSNVKHFILCAASSTVFNYLPGQFISIHFTKDNALLKRSYSIANPPNNRNCIEFTANYVPHGPGTNFLFNLKSGDTVNVSGPFGRLILRDTIPERYLLVATNTGITPYRAMLDELKSRLNSKPGLKIIILQGVPSRSDILFANDFVKFSQDFHQVVFRAQLSRHSKNEPLQEHEHVGYVQDAFTELNLDPARDSVYLCGKPSMIDDAFTRLKACDFTPQQIIREKYI